MKNFMYNDVHSMLFIKNDWKQIKCTVIKKIVPQIMIYSLEKSCSHYKG